MGNNLNSLLFKGYMGRHCESKQNFCESSPCQNGGICAPEEAGHTCICANGYYGKNCQFSGSDCDSSPCSSSGVCKLNEGGGYRCECQPGEDNNFGL